MVEGEREAPTTAMLRGLKIGSSAFGMPDKIGDRAFSRTSRMPETCQAAPYSLIHQGFYAKFNRR